MNPKNKSKKKDKRKARTPKRVTRNNPLVSDIETADDSQQEEVPDSQESEGEDEPELVPTLPSGEWYMPNLRNTTLTEVMKKGAPYEGDNTGRILMQFPKLKPYTKFDYYLVSPYTGEVDLYDPDNSKRIAFSVKTTRGTCRKQHNHSANTSIYEETKQREMATNVHPRRRHTNTDQHSSHDYNSRGNSDNI